MNILYARKLDNHRAALVIDMSPFGKGILGGVIHINHMEYTLPFYRNHHWYDYSHHLDMKLHLLWEWYKYIENVDDFVHDSEGTGWAAPPVLELPSPQKLIE